MAWQYQSPMGRREFSSFLGKDSTVNKSRTLAVTISLPHFLFPSVKAFFLAVQDFSSGLSWFQILNCNSLLVPKKWILVKKRLQSICRDQRRTSQQLQDWGANACGTHRVHSCSLLYSPTMEFEGVSFSWICLTSSLHLMPQELFRIYLKALFSGKGLVLHAVSIWHWSLIWRSDCFNQSWVKCSLAQFQKELLQIKLCRFSLSLSLGISFWEWLLKTPWGTQVHPWLIWIT